MDLQAHRHEATGRMVTALEAKTAQQEGGISSRDQINVLRRLTLDVFRVGNCPLLTSYFITTERAGWETSLQTLRQQPVDQQIVVVRNVRPIRAAFSEALKSSTAFTLVMDDDILLRDGTLRQILLRFQLACLRHRRLFRGSYLVHDELFGQPEPHGVKMFRTALLRQVGWPDACHLGPAQIAYARRLGLTARFWRWVVGVHRRGSALDIYKRLLWIQIRWNTNRDTWNPPPSPQAFYERWKAAGDVAHLYACLGVLDGLAVGRLQMSKDEAFLGPHGQQVDWASPNAEDLTRLVESLGIGAS